MKKDARDLIAEFNRDGRFCGTCPNCSEDFRLRDASLFPIDGEKPEKALAAIRLAKEAIAERKKEIASAKERMTKRAEKTAQAVNLGKIIEKIVPSFPSFSYSAGDCRALFEPIDYLIFSGLSAPGGIEALYFVDVKSGAARLNSGQRSIKQAVERGAVRFKFTEKREPNANN